MEESPEEVEKRETLLGMYSSLKDSLKVLQTFNLNKVGYKNYQSYYVYLEVVIKF